MTPENRRMLLTIAAVAAIIVGGYAALIAYTGMSVPFSAVMSQSMQHDNERSQIGCIDTGDIVIVKSKNGADVQSYVEGTLTGMRTFGDYGSVIIYERGGSANPVIHRAIVWLEWDSDRNAWTSEELKDYKGTWYCRSEGEDTKDPMNLVGTLVFENITQSEKRVTVSLDRLDKGEGFLTLGDNPITNNSFDQQSGIVSHLISMDDIRSVPFAELPWIGAVKMMTGNNSSNLKYVPNSLPSLAMAIILIVGAICAADLCLQWRSRNKEGL